MSELQAYVSSTYHDHASAPFAAWSASPAYTEQPTRVVIGVASPALLYGLEAIIRDTAGVSFACAATSLASLVDACVRLRDGVVLADPLLGGAGAPAFVERLKAAAPNVRIVLMTDAHQPHTVREAVRSGANAFVGKLAQADEIRAALAAAAHGRRYVAPEIATQLAEALILEDLTQREMQVLGLLSIGDCNKTIARHLDVTVGTVKTHVRAIMFKLGSRSRTEAVHKAYRLGLVCLDR